MTVQPLTEQRRPYLYETERVGVRGLSRAELSGGYQHWFNDLEVCAFNAHGAFPMSPRELEAYVDSVSGSRSQVVWAVFDRATDTHIGNMSLQNIHPITRSAEFAVIMGEKAYWGKGYAREAAQLLFTHGFNRLNLHRIYCGTATLNVGMQRLAKGLHMHPEGVRFQAMYVDGRYVDVLEYGVTRDEFFSGTAHPDRQS